MAFEGKWIHGSAIDKVTREVSFLSVSQVELGDSCLRKWWYRYPGGIKEASTPKQERGVKNHAEVARYELTGDKNVGPMVAKGMFMVPPPGPDLLVEWDILTRPGFVYPGTLTEAHSRQLLRDAPLRFNNIPMVGQLDLSHGRGINYGTDNVEATKDPEGTIEVCDWKFVSSDRYLLSSSELKSNTQLAGYAEWVFVVRPQTPQVRISLGYFLEKGRSRKITTLVHREDIVPQLEHAGGVARSIAHAAKALSAEDVDANTAACSKYGGCVHQAYCTAPMRRSLSSLIGQTAAESAIVPRPNPHTITFPFPQGIIPVSSLLQRANSGVQSAVSVAPAIVGPDPAAVAAEQARIVAEEKAAQLRQLVPAGFVEACAAVRSFNRGFPKLTGAAAVAYAASGGQAVAPGVEFLGSGMIDYVVLTEASQMAQLANDLAGEAPSEPMNALPPDAPSSDPALAADMPVTHNSTFAMAAAVAESAPVPVTVNPVATYIATIPAAAASLAPDPMKSEAAAPKKRGRGPAKPKAPDTKVENDVKDPTDHSLHIFVNCTTTLETIDLTEWAQNLADTLARVAGADDIRSASEDSNLGYSKWKGVLMAFARDAEHAPLDGGNYSLITRDEISEVVAQALLLRARLTGGSYTRGAR